MVNINPSEPPLEKGRNIYCHPELFGRACPELVEGLRINSVKNLGFVSPINKATALRKKPLGRGGRWLIFCGMLHRC